MNTVFILGYGVLYLEIRENPVIFHSSNVNDIININAKMVAIAEDENSIHNIVEKWSE
jgi:hypothetical protein